MTPELFLNNAGVVAVMMVLLWIASVFLKDASIVDPFWSLGFLLIAICTAVQTGTLSTAGWLLLVTVAVWSLRLSIYLFVRNHGEPEDPRYQAFRRHFGPERYWWFSLFQVFGLQGGLMLLVSLPLQVALGAGEHLSLGVASVFGAVLAVAGTLTEAVADRQLARFRADPDNRGQVMDKGLWRYSRHPNYFGEAVLWWGFWLQALPVEGAWLSAVGPALMTFLLVRVSGVAMLEATLTRTKPKYHDYIRRTSAFVPRPPKPQAM